MAEQLRLLAAFSEAGSSIPCRRHIQVSVSRTIQHSSSHDIWIKDFKKEGNPFLDIEFCSIFLRCLDSNCGTPQLQVNSL